MSLAAELARLAAHGIVVFAMPPGAKYPPPAGWQTSTADPAQIPAGSNAGVGCRINNVVVLDVDQVDELSAFCASQGRQLPGTLTVATPSGGQHLYYVAPAGRVIPSSSGRRCPLPGADVRAPGRRSGGYVLAPGSVIDGQAYAIVCDQTPVPLPGWLATLLTAPGGIRPSRRHADRLRAMPVSWESSAAA